MRRSVRAAVLALLASVCCLAIAPGAALAVPAPANDDHANAQVIPGAGGTVTGTTSEAGWEPTEYYNAYYSDYQGAVWYRWTAPATAPAPFKVTFHLCANEPSLEEMQTLDIAAFLGSDGINDRPPIHPYSDDCSGLPADATSYGLTSFTATPGQTYHVGVYGFSVRDFVLTADVPKSAIFKDLDGDGIPDDIDTDIDGDGVPNKLELAMGLNPYKADSDGDGIRDDVHLCKFRQLCQILPDSPFSKDDTPKKIGGNENDIIFHDGDKPSTCDGRKGNDTCVGGGGADTCLARAGNDECIGRGGNDSCVATSGKDLCNGGRGNDTCDGTYRASGTASAIAHRLDCVGSSGKDECTLEVVMNPRGEMTPTMRCKGGSGSDSCEALTRAGAAAGALTHPQKPIAICLGGSGNDTCETEMRMGAGAVASAVGPITTCIGGSGNDTCSAKTSAKDKHPGKVTDGGQQAPKTRCSGGTGTDSCVDRFDPKATKLESKTVCIGGSGDDMCVSMPNGASVGAAVAPGSSRLSCVGGSGNDILSTQNGSGGDFINGGPGNDICISDKGDVVTGCERRIVVDQSGKVVKDISVDGQSTTADDEEVMRRMAEQIRKQIEELRRAQQHALAQQLLEKERQKQLEETLKKIQKIQQEMAKQPSEKQQEKVEKQIQQTIPSVMGGGRKQIR